MLRRCVQMLKQTRREFDQLRFDQPQQDQWRLEMQSVVPPIEVQTQTNGQLSKLGMAAEHSKWVGLEQLGNIAAGDDRASIEVEPEGSESLEDYQWRYQR